MKIKITTKAIDSLDPKLKVYEVYDEIQSGLLVRVLPTNGVLREKTSPHIIEHMLNHQPRNKLVATYQQAIHAEEQKQAWLGWGEMVERQIACDPGNVVPIKTALMLNC